MPEFCAQRGFASFLRNERIEETGKLTSELVQCITLDTLLDQYDMSQVDFLQIDVESFDYDILKLIDFDRIRPKFIRHEHRHLGATEKQLAKKLLHDRRYRILEMEFDTAAIYLE